MDEFCISYSPKRKIDFYYLFFSVYGIIIGAMLCMKEILAKNYSIIFYCAAVFVVLAVILFLYVLKSKPKPLLSINNESVSFNFAGQKPASYLWKDITKIGIGISSFTIENDIAAAVSIEAGSLKYTDLKNTKSKIIEICENKDIPFSNT